MSFSSLTRAVAGLTLLLLGWSATPVSAQQTPIGSISGTVVDPDTNDPVPSATIALLSVPDTSLVTGAITTAEGTFHLENVRRGTYALRVSYVGYEPRIVSDVEVTAAQPDVALGEIELSPSTTALEGVDVSAERLYMQFEVDRTVYDVENQPLTAGGSASDALDQLPSVTIDFDGSISLRGNENVAIYLNGQPSPMTGESLIGFLNSLPADAIERIEVIPNPTAAFEPEGMAGIINIVLAKEQEIGLGGGVSVSASTQNEYRGSGNVRYGSGPWNVYANYGLRYGQRESTGYQLREYLDPGAYPSLPPMLEQNELSERGGISQHLNATVDYALSDINTLSFSGLVSHRNRSGEQRRLYDRLDEDQTLLSQYHRVTDDEGSEVGMDGRLTFQRIVEPRRHELEIEANVDYEEGVDIERYTQREGEIGDGGEIVERQHVEEEEREMEAELEANYKRPLTDILRLEAGYESAWEREDTDFSSETFNTATGRFENDASLGNTFVFDEIMHSVFGILSAELGDFGLQGGGRLEQASTALTVAARDTSYDNSYFSFFPSVHLSYKPAQSHLMRLSYSKRVNRPNTWQLNPIGDFDDATSIRRGNPQLEPEYTHSFELGYTNLGEHHTASITPYYRYTVNAIAWDEQLQDDGVTITTYENFATRSSSGVELMGSLNPFDWLDVTGSFNVYQRVTDGSNVRQDLGSDAWGYSTRLSGTAEVREGLSLQFSQFYRSPIDVPSGHRDAFTSTSMALRQQLFDGRASLSLSARDVFDTMNFEMLRETDDFREESVHDWGAQSVRLSFRYNFGEQEDRPRRQDPSDQEPEGEMPGGGMGM